MTEFVLDSSKHQFFLDFDDLGHKKSHQVVFDQEQKAWFLVISECPNRCFVIEESERKPRLKVVKAGSLAVHYIEIDGNSYYLCHFNDKHADKYQPVFDKFREFDSPAPNFDSDSGSDEESFEMTDDDKQAFGWYNENRGTVNEFFAASDPSGFLREHCSSKMIKKGIGLGFHWSNREHPNRERCVEAWQEFEI